MFEATNQRGRTRSSFQLAELMFHWTVRELSSGKRNVVIGILVELGQGFVFISVFFGLFSMMGMRGSPPIRGDLAVFLASGILLFLIHTKTVKTVMKASTPNSGLVLHTPLNTGIMIVASAGALLFKQIISTFIMLFVYHLITGNVAFQNFIGFAAMFLLAWATGVCFGILLMGLNVVLPTVAAMVSTIYQRMNMLFSGKMSPANSLSASMLPLFDWNPLFHIIDQARGYVFLNYTPRHTTLEYPIKVALICLTIGLMGEFYARRFASNSRLISRI